MDTTITKEILEMAREEVTDMSEGEKRKTFRAPGSETSDSPPEGFVVQVSELDKQGMLALKSITIDGKTYDVGLNTSDEDWEPTARRSE